MNNLNECNIIIGCNNEILYKIVKLKVNYIK